MTLISRGRRRIAQLEHERSSSEQRSQGDGQIKCPTINNRRRQIVGCDPRAASTPGWTDGSLTRKALPRFELVTSVFADAPRTKRVTVSGADLTAAMWNAQLTGLIMARLVTAFNST